MRTLFVSDLDGTLLTPESVVSATSARMLNEATARGAMFTVATARTPATVSTLLADIDMRLPAVVMTGGALYDFSRSRLFRPKFMDRTTASCLVGDWRVSGLSTFIYTLDGAGILQVYHIGRLSDVERDFMAQRSGTTCKVFNVPSDGESDLPSDLGHTMLFFGMQPTAPARQLYEQVSRDYGDTITPQFYHDIYGDAIAELEMFPHDVSKASALERLASDLAADRLVVFGDNINDIPMMRLADEAVAVANAKEEVKRYATAVIGSNTEDSVARFILGETK